MGEDLAAALGEVFRCGRGVRGPPVGETASKDFPRSLRLFGGGASAVYHGGGQAGDGYLRGTGGESGWDGVGAVEQYRNGGGGPQARLRSQERNRPSESLAQKPEST